MSESFCSEETSEPPYPDPSGGALIVSLSVVQPMFAYLVTMTIRRKATGRPASNHSTQSSAI